MNTRITFLFLFLLASVSASSVLAQSPIKDRDYEMLAITSNVLVASEDSDHQLIREQIGNLLSTARNDKERLDAKVLLAVDYLNTTDTNDIHRGRQIAQDVINADTSSWHAVWAYTCMAAADATLADYSNQIVSLTAALRLASQDQYAHEEDPLFIALSKGQGAYIANNLRRVLVGAYCRGAQFEDAERICEEITDKATYERARNAIEYDRKKLRSGGSLVIE